jgi:isopenicillin-N epimerase
VNVNTLKDLFLLDPNVIFLNHGSFGAMPRSVFESYQAWQRKLERQPVQFLVSDFPEFDKQARRCLGDYLGADPNDLVFIQNATTGVNIVARSLALKQGDEVLTSNHEYGACDKTWEFICQKRGARYIRQPIPLPAPDENEMIELIWQGVTPKTRLIFLSHITSATALRLPIASICERARSAGILTLIDGAHAPGQISVDLEAIGADFYSGNLHKWALSPRGAAFLYTRKDRQDLLEPLVVSWGWNAQPAFSSGSRYIDNFLWQGTKDPSAALAVPDAIRFQREHHWSAVRTHCHDLLSQAVQRISALTGLPQIYSSGEGHYAQMATALLPNSADLIQLKQQLYDDFRIEVPCLEWEGLKLIRISIQGYNSQSDVDELVNALANLLQV